MAAMNYAIQCTDTASGETGCFGFDTEEYLQADKRLQFKAKTPVFSSLDDLFNWARENGVELFCVPVVWQGQHAEKQPG